MAASNTPFQSASSPSNVVTESLKYTYSCGASVAVAAAATDVFVLSNGNGTKKIRVTRAGVTGLGTTALSTPVSLIKRTILNTGGTSTLPVILSHDSAIDPITPSGVINLYTANATISSTAGSFGTMRNQFVDFNVATATRLGLLLNFTDANDQAIVLNPNESLAVNLGGQTVTGGVLSAFFEWTEE